MDNLALIIHVLSASVLLGGQVLLFFAVTPSTWLIDDERLRRSVTRVVVRRFGKMTAVALGLLVLTGIYQFVAIVPEPVQRNMGDYRFGPAFIAKMALLLLFVALVAVHGIYFGRRIGRASDAVAEGGSDETVRRLEDLRRTSLVFSLLMVLVTAGVVALGVVVGNHTYAYVER